MRTGARPGVIPCSRYLQISGVQPAPPRTPVLPPIIRAFTPLSPSPSSRAGCRRRRSFSSTSPDRARGRPRAPSGPGTSVRGVIDPEAPPPAPSVPRQAGSPGRLVTVTAEGGGLEFLADGCADGVIAEDRTLSLRLAAEDLGGELARVLRPGGRVLACVDSLTFGMAVLAEQHRWPHLVDVPNADVVLIPWPDGTITRCYGAEQLGELLAGGGLEVSWIRPRTVFSPQTVSYLLARDPARFGALVNAELHARADDSVGTQLLTSA